MPKRTGASGSREASRGQKHNAADKLCFVLSPIGKARSEDRARADGVLNEIIRPAIEPLGFRVVRADEDTSPGIVTERMIEKILEADLVVADLSGHNPNVMYEVAVRHAYGGAIVQMIEESQPLPFDIKDFNTIFFRPTLEGRSDAISQLQSAVQAISGGTEVRNPVFRAVQMRVLQQGNKPESEIVADALKELRELASEMRSQLSRESRGTPPGSSGREPLRREIVELLRSNAQIVEAAKRFDAWDVLVFFNEPDDFFYLILHCWDDDGFNALTATATHAPEAMSWIKVDAIALATEMNARNKPAAVNTG